MPGKETKMAIEAQSEQELVQLMYKGGSMMFHVGKGTGKGGIKLAAYIQAKLKAASENKLSGALDISRLNRDGQPITFYTFSYEDFKMIQKKVKEYGLVYSVVYDKKNKTGEKEVVMFIRKVDAVKLERILDTMNVGVVEPDLSCVKVKESRNGIIEAEVDLGEVEDTEKKAVEPDLERDPFDVTPSVVKSPISKAENKRNSIRTEVEQMKALQKPVSESEQKILTSPEVVNMDEQLAKEFTGQSKGMDMK